MQAKGKGIRRNRDFRELGVRMLLMRCREENVNREYGYRANDIQITPTCSYLGICTEKNVKRGQAQTSRSS